MQRPTQQEVIATLDNIIATLSGGARLENNPDLIHMFYCMSAEELESNPSIQPGHLSEIIAGLSAADVPTFVAARDAVLAGTQAWLGFKVVTDPAVVLDSVDTSAWNFNGPGQGSADDQPGIFYANDAKEIVYAREISPRDRKQMLDITRGPHMHHQQYAGVAWTSQPLIPEGRVIMLGAGDVSVQLARIAAQYGFQTVVVDNTADFLNAERFPLSERVLLDDFASIKTPGENNVLDALQVNEYDFPCVLTRGHAYDTEAIIWAAQTPAGYIGMMGNPMKNDRVFELAAEAGIAPELLQGQRMHAPIGIALGDKTPTGLAISIIAEIIKVKYDRSH